MWILTVRSPSGEPCEYSLKTGRTTIGRKSDNDIVVQDDSASRHHADIFVDVAANLVTLRDLGSTNGTYINRERVTQPHVLRLSDQVRIGEHILTLSIREGERRRGTDRLPQTQPLTRDLLLESVDQHAVLLYEAASRLNTIIDLDTALAEVSDLMRRSMGAEKCTVIQAERFDRLSELGFPTSYARQAIEQRSAVFISEIPNAGDQAGRSALLLRVRAAMAVPVLIEDEVAALIYVYKTDPASRPFTQTDMQLAIAISHQAALTIQRTRLLRRVRQSDRISHFFRRFFSPQEADLVLQNYLDTGELPGLTEQVLTILFLDIRDSTGIAERLGAHKFGALLTQYYQEMTEVIFEHGGLINAYMGDGILVVYGALGRPEPEERAVRTALGMLQRLTSLNQNSDEQITLAIGINTGPVMAGYVGTSERVEYTILGETVNIAQRLERHARHNRIYIGLNTHNAIAGRFQTRSIGTVELRGFSKSIDVFEVLP